MQLADIFETYYDRIYSFVLFRVQNVHDAQDISSEVFFRAAKSYDTYDKERASVSTWLFSIALNEIKRHHRHQKNDLALEQAADIPATACTLDDVLASERAKELFAAMGQLSRQQRDILLLRYYGEMTNREIAVALGLSETNVETIAYRAKKKLKTVLETCEVFATAGYKVV